MLPPINWTATPPIQTVQHPTLAAAAVQLLIVREDLVHPYLQGNKWRKLQYNLQEMLQIKALRTILTYGGAHSNHIYATAAAGRILNLRTIGIIRGERTEPLNVTLAFAEKCGMHLHFVSRTAYREKNTPEFAAQMRDLFGDAYIIPEGGSNVLAVRGVAAMIDALPDCDYLAVACGTGATAAGLLVGRGLRQKKMDVLAFAVLKGGDFLATDIVNFCKGYDAEFGESRTTETAPLQLITAYHFGGYAKTKPELLAFCADFMARTGISIEPVYTGKMLFGLFDKIKNGDFAAGSTIVAVHTGGLRS
jgi:1-aminocyclopropane-1-carboxylate deaminase